MDAIKHLANKTGVTLVLMGIPEAKTLRGLDEQYKSRYRPKALTRFEQCDKEFCDFLKRIEAEIAPPKPIGFGDKKIYLPQLLFEQSKGKIGYLVPIIQEAFGILGAFDDDINEENLSNLTPDILNDAYKIIQGDLLDDILDNKINFG